MHKNISGSNDPLSDCLNKIKVREIPQSDIDTFDIKIDAYGIPHPKGIITIENKDAGTFEETSNLDDISNYQLVRDVKGDINIISLGLVIWTLLLMIYLLLLTSMLSLNNILIHELS